MIVKLCTTVIIVVFVVPILCAGAANNGSAVVPDESAVVPYEPPVLMGGLRGLLRTVAVEIAPEMYSFKYEEPGLMTEEGLFGGIKAAVTIRPWPHSRFGLMSRLEGRFAIGQVDYVGETWGSTPITIDGIDNFAMEARLLLGPDFVSEYVMLTLFTGIASRYLNDNASTLYSGAYERESNYLYLPLGLEMVVQGNGGWCLGTSAEFDVFLGGIQKTHLSDVGYTDVENIQNEGYGLRCSIKLEKKSESVDFIIEPFFRYWHIDDSEIMYVSGVGSVWEPENETHEVGIRLILVF